MEINPPGFYKQKFLEDNRDYAYIQPTHESTTIGEFQDIDVNEDEVWLLQCPRGTDIGTLQGQKLKFPGRSHLHDLEAVAVEFESPETKSFGYCNRKGKYALRLLPIKGSVLLRDRLKANELVNADQIESICPSMGRVPVPQFIKVRHPLLGVQYEDKLLLEEAIAERLRKADETSAKVLRETRNRMTRLAQSRSSISATSKCIADTSADDVAVSSHMQIHKKKKDKRIKSEQEDNVVEYSAKKIKKEKVKYAKEEDVSEDLQWLKAL